MSFLNQLQNIDVTTLDDMTDVKVGGESRGLLPTGTAYVRPCMYIEYGSHVQTFNGQPKPAAPIFKLGFRIVGGGGLNIEGKPEKYVLEEGKFPLITTFDTTLGFFEKSKSIQYFNALNRVGNKATHFVQKIAEQCIYALPIGVKKNKQGKDVQDIDFTNLQVALNQETFEQRTGDPALSDEHIQVFLWDTPTIEMWDSIFIEGEFPAQKDDSGKITKPARSRNLHQEKCLSALNFEGSPLQVLLQEKGKSYTIPELPTTPDVPEEAPSEPAAVTPPPTDGAVLTPPDLD